MLATQGVSLKHRRSSRRCVTYLQSGVSPEASAIVLIASSASPTRRRRDKSPIYSTRTNRKNAAQTNVRPVGLGRPHGGPWLSVHPEECQMPPQKIRSFAQYVHHRQVIVLKQCP